MINLVQVIGVQRFVKFLILLMINIALGFLIYSYILPEMKASEKEYKTVKNEVLRLNADINNIEDRLVELKKNEKQYKRLLKRGFISDQDRVDIRGVIDDMRQRSGVQTLNYNIRPIQYVENDLSYALEGDIIKSEIDVDVTALLDLEVLALQEMFNEEFPGLMVLEEVNYERTNPITKGNLKRVGNNEKIDFMRGGFRFSWYSLTEEKAQKEVVQ